MDSIRRCLATGALAALVLPWVAHAQAPYPSKPIVVIRPTAPGGSDGPLQIIAQQVSSQLKQSVVYDSRPGAGGNIAAMAVKQAAPDGYTLFLGHPGPLAINHSLFAALPYDPIKDFEPIIMLTSYPLIMLVPTSSSAKTVQELLAAGKGKPGGLSFGSPGIGTTTHLIGEMIKVQSGVPMQHVAYKGASPALLDLVGGRLDFFMTGYSSAAAFLKDGRLRALAVTSERRSPQMPTVPTLTEAGLNDLTFGNWQGLVAPAGTPRPVIERLNTEFARAMQSDEARKIAATLALDPPQAMSPEQFGAIIKTDAERFAKAIKASGARAAD